jgi:VCBS repeat-containing protein
MTAQFRLGLATFGYRGGSQQNNYILQDIKANADIQTLFVNVETSELTVDVEDGTNKDVFITVEGAY